MVLFISIRSFVTGAIVTVYNHAIGPCYLFQLCYLFHDRSRISETTEDKVIKADENNQVDS